MHSERTVFDLIGLIYDSAGDASRWPVFLERFGQAMRATGANLFAQDLRDHRFSVAAQLGFEPESERSYETYYKDRNVYLTRGNRRLKTGTVSLSQDLCPDHVAFRTEFYNDWIAPQKQHYGVLGVIYRKRSLVSMVGAIRPRGKPPFGPDEVSLIELLIPHLQRAVSLHRRIADLENQRSAATSALDHWSMGVFLLDGQGRLLLMNRKAEEILGQKDGLELTREGPCASFTNETLTLRHLIKDAIATRLGQDGESGGAMGLTRPSLKRALNVLVTPLFAQNAFPTRKGAVAAIFISDPDAREETDSELVRQLFDLTPAEAQVTALLITGEDLKHVAQILQVTMNTARTHLKRVFDKTGTKRQAELVRLLLQSPAHVWSKS
jgi:DNA-binding CsgD family transcriptional regulator/PAS domain-containing protein